MKLLILLLVTGIAAAAAESSLLRDAQPLLSQLASLPVELQRARSGQSLAEALGVPQSDELDSFETEIRSEIGQHTKEFIENLLSSVSDASAHAKSELTQIYNQISDETPSSESVQKFIDDLTSLQKTRDAVEIILDSTFEGTNLQVVTWYSVEERGIADWWEKIKNWFNGIGSWISDKYGEFKNWAKDVFQKVIDAAKPILSQVKDLAIEFLKNNWDTITIELVKQAMNFFVPFSGAIGEKIMTQLIALARSKGWIPWENFYRLLL
jgi:gas vesicle protein